MGGCRCDAPAARVCRGRRGVLQFEPGAGGRLFEQFGFRILETRGIPAPFPLVMAPRPAKLFLRLNEMLIRLSKRLFSYQIYLVVAPYPTLGEIGKRAAGNFYAPRLFSAGTRRLVRLLQRLP